MPPIRERATPKALLGELYQKDPAEPLPRPKSLSDSHDYDRAQALLGLQYADSTLRSPIAKPPPRVELAFIIYRDACADFLDFDRFNEARFEDQANDLKWQLGETIQTFEQDLEQKPVLMPAKNECEQKIQEKVLCLIRWTLSIRYSACAVLPKKWKKLDETFWKETKLLLRMEEYNEFLSGTSREERCPRTLELLGACDRTGIHLDAVRWIMDSNPGSEWVPPNGNLGKLVKSGRHIELRQMLRDDYQMVSRVISQSEKDILEGLKDHIRDCIDFWFIRGSLDNCANWTPTIQLENRVEIPWDRAKYLEDEQGDQRRRRYDLSPRPNFKKVTYEPTGLMIFGPRVDPGRRPTS